MATFCLLHGAWHDASCWEQVVEGLQARGHAAVAPDLPLHDSRAGYEERIRPALGATEAAAGPLVVVGHSAGSGYAALVAAARPGSLLVHLCPRLGPFEPPGAPAAIREGFPFPPDGPDGTSVWDPQAAIDVMYRRLPAETAHSLAQRLRPLARVAGDYPLAGHPDVPTVLVYAAEDEFFQPAFERLMARELGIDPIEIPGGHFPMVEDPEGLTELLDRLSAQARGSS